jgi:hypothetical protein
MAEWGNKSMSLKISNCFLHIRSNGKKRVASWLAVTLIAGLFVPVQFLAPASASTATTSCGTFVGGGNPTFSNVQNFLLKKLGVEASRVSVAKTPVGEKKPAASNTTKAGQAKNRRTELWLR